MDLQPVPRTIEPVQDDVTGGLERDDFPALSVAAAAAAHAGQRKYKSLVRFEVGLLLASALFSASGNFSKSMDPGWEQKIAALFLAVALILKVLARHGAYDRIWFDGRAVAETVKSAAWRYVMRIPPYSARKAVADAAFIQSVDAALAARPDLVRHLGQLPSGGRVITDAMRDLRRRDLAERRAIYLRRRVDDQIDWYSGKAAANRRAAERWFGAGLVCEGAALLLAIVQIEAEWVPIPNLAVGLLAAVAIAATAWTQLDRHDELSKGYALAAYELSRLRLAVEAADDALTFAQAVEGIEGAVSREHTMWMAKRA